MRSPAPARFDASALGVPIPLAVVFLLRIRRHPDGRLDFQMEHKPGDSKHLTHLRKRIAALLSGAGASGD